MGTFSSRSDRLTLVRDRSAPSLESSALAATRAPRLVVENFAPSVDDGRYPARRIVGDWVHVEVDAYGEGHDKLAVVVKWQTPGKTDWQETRMQPLGNDRWGADIQLETVGSHVFMVEAWRDEFATYRDQLEKKVAAGLVVTLEIEEGLQLLRKVLRATEVPSVTRLRALIDELYRADAAERQTLLLADETAEIMAAMDPRPFRVRLDRTRRIEAERLAAAYASWYELFPRSQSGDPTRHGTFDDVIRRLPAVKAMGFDVVYFPPIHPIGRKNRKGRNNSLVAAPDDPGSPYAIGSSEGGHEAIHPALGTFDDFDRLVAAARGEGLEIALDIAIQASPDHPWLKEHPEWFDWRPDGTVRYAENPPKKYEDIVNVDFYAEGAKPSLWLELRDMLLKWVDHGIKIFRVDNPHTKPFPFWEWVIAEVRERHPDVIFLSEAFTRPKVMYRLAKIGFSQSYTYFTWRDTKMDLTDYFSELSNDAPKEFFRPHLFVNTHDINPDFLQTAPRAAFLIRAVLAATLSGLWGVYNGFELCEGRPDAKKKEYANSEKYQIVAWDWDRPGNIRSEITVLNRIRRDNPALHSHLRVRFLTTSNDQVIAYVKTSYAGDNRVLVIVNLDPHRAQEAEIDMSGLVAKPEAVILADDLIGGGRMRLADSHLRVRLDTDMPYAIWRLAPEEPV